MKISDDDRKEIFELYTGLEFRLRSLKAIVQNPLELTLEELNEHSNMTDELIRKLGTLNRYICDKAINTKNI